MKFRVLNVLCGIFYDDVEYRQATYQEQNILESHVSIHEEKRYYCLYVCHGYLYIFAYDCRNRFMGLCMSIGDRVAGGPRPPRSQPKTERSGKNSQSIFSSLDRTMLADYTMQCCNTLQYQLIFVAVL